MGKIYEISIEEAEEIKEYRKNVKDKFTDRRMYAVQLRGEGLKSKEIAEKLSIDKRMVSKYVSLFRKGGIKNLENKPRSGRPAKMTYEEEEKMLAKFKEKAEAGHIIEVSEIKAEYESITGSSKSHGQIYCVLHRHGWRKIKPRSKHPKKASDEAIEVSKKLSRL